MVGGKAANGLLFVLVMSILVLGVLCSASGASVCIVNFNGLEIGIDEQTGCVVRLSHPGTGAVFLEAASKSAELLDVAYPVEAFLPMRLAARFSRAQVVKESDKVILSWDRLGPSRGNIALPDSRNKVSARVIIRKALDGKSVVLTCHMQNDTTVPIPQILFPALGGIRPFAGSGETKLHFAWTSDAKPAARPFIEFGGPRSPDDAWFYAGRCWRQYSLDSEGKSDSLIPAGALNLAGPTSGLTISLKNRPDSKLPGLLVYHGEVEPQSLRLLWENRININKGQTWDSGEVWLTPHGNP